MDSNPKDPETLKQLSEKLGLAVDFLYQEFKKNEILELINSKLSHPITSSNFSKYHGFRNKPDYYRDINARTFSKIFAIIDPYMESVCSMVWNGTKYVKISAELLEEKINPKLKALNGTWEGFSWDAGNSKVNKKGYIHHFKFKISLSSIICETLAGVFKGKHITIITTDRIAIGLSRTRPARKIYFIIYVGNLNSPKLHEVEDFKIAYVDSGEIQVKAGLAIIKRSKSDYAKFRPTSSPIEKFEHLLSKAELRFLRKKQLIIESKAVVT